MCFQSTFLETLAAPYPNVGLEKLRHKDQLDYGRK